MITEIKQENTAEPISFEKKVDTTNLQKKLEEPDWFRYFVEVILNGVKVYGGVDTGAVDNYISADVVRKCNLDDAVEKIEQDTYWCDGKTTTIGLIEKCKINIGDCLYSTELSVFRKAWFDMLLGLNTLRELRTTIDFKETRFAFCMNNTEISLPISLKWP